MCNLELINHILIHSGEGLFKCQDCGKEFAKINRYNAHQMSHNPRPCPSCEKKYRSHSALRSHIDSVHENISSICLKCEKVFRTASSLRKHQQKNVCFNEINFKHVKCNQCELKFKNKRCLTAHIKNKHSTQARTKGK